MTPKRLLADLIRQGFRLAVCGNCIEVAPRSRLTESIRQDIRKHKGGLMALLRTEGPLDGQLLSQGKDQPKARRRVPAKKSSVRPNDDGGKGRSAPNSDAGAPAPAGIRETGPTATQDPTRLVPAPEPNTPPAIPPKFIQKPKRLAPLLCPPCRRLGYANCRECMLATDSSLTLDGDEIFGVRLPTAQDRWPWHRCKRCDNSFKAPLYPALSLCPDCVAEDSRQPAQHPSSGEPR
jgi:hypothetical protein